MIDYINLIDYVYTYNIKVINTTYIATYKSNNGVILKIYEHLCKGGDNHKFKLLKIEEIYKGNLNSYMEVGTSKLGGSILANSKYITCNKKQFKKVD